MKKPLVSVICLCYNHSSYVGEAIQSVFQQTYDEVELIVVDDGSTDGSPQEIRNLLDGLPNVEFLALEENQGNCKAFNQGLKLAQGKYVIDLAADDVLCPERIELGVKALEAVGESYAVHFTDAYFINKKSEMIGSHYPRDNAGKLLIEVPQGDVYADLLARYIVCTPTMMMRKSVLDELGGYDELLAYEDFDFWVRSSRNYNYLYTDAILVKKRLLNTSLSMTQYTKNSPMLWSTFQVCEKAYTLNRNKYEDEALIKRIRYELRQALLSANYPVARKFLELLQKIQGKGFFYFWAYMIIKTRINWRIIRRIKNSE
jgi:glycosyltransferase involved in cell wall biosynthesis